MQITIERGESPSNIKIWIRYEYNGLWYGQYILTPLPISKEQIEDAFEQLAIVSEDALKILKEKE